MALLDWLAARVEQIARGLSILGALAVLFPAVLASTLVAPGPVRAQEQPGGVWCNQDTTPAICDASVSSVCQQEIQANHAGPFVDLVNTSFWFEENCKYWDGEYLIGGLIDYK